MSLDRKDIRAKLDPQMHAALKVLARVQGMTEAEFIEASLVPVIRQRIHDASVIAAEAALLGISGNRREPTGKTGSRRE